MGVPLWFCTQIKPGHAAQASGDDVCGSIASGASAAGTHPKPSFDEVDTVDVTDVARMIVSCVSTLMSAAETANTPSPSLREK